MKRAPRFPLFVFCVITIVVLSQPSSKGQRQIGCQHRSTSGRDYVGGANITVDGLHCQRWSDTDPHDHDFTHVGDHNFCRNPNGEASQSQVWCYTTDPEHQKQNCSVQFCPSLKALDLSLDNDHKPDESNSYTHASLKKANLPPSFTICTALMVEAWTEYTGATLFVLHDDNGKIWHWVQIVPYHTYTEFSFKGAGAFHSAGQSKEG